MLMFQKCNIYKYFLWLLKLGAFINLYFFIMTISLPLKNVDPYLLIPAQILFFVSAYRCLFPVNYVTRAVLHDSIFSSIFITRFLATFVEVAYIYQFSYLIRLINANQVYGIDIISWVMVIQVIISQFFVWGAILVRNEKYYFYEEIGWGVIFLINTIISIILLYSVSDLGANEVFLYLNLIFGIVYLPWQGIHLKAILARLHKKPLDSNYKSISFKLLKEGFLRSIRMKNCSTKSEMWGGLVGMTWMVFYWATLIPFWLFFIINTYI